MAVGCRREEQAEGGCWYLHALRNPQGEYVWADEGHMPPRQWQREARVLHGPRDYAAALAQRRESLGSRAGGSGLETPFNPFPGSVGQGVKQLERGMSGKAGSYASWEADVVRLPEPKESLVRQGQQERVRARGQALREDAHREGRRREGVPSSRNRQRKAPEDETRAGLEQQGTERVGRKSGDEKQGSGAVRGSSRARNRAEAREGSCSDTDSFQSGDSGGEDRDAKVSKTLRRRSRSPDGGGVRYKRLKRRRPDVARITDPEKQAEEEQRLRRLLLERQQALLGRPRGGAAREESCSDGQDADSSGSAAAHGAVPRVLSTGEYTRSPRHKAPSQLLHQAMDLRASTPVPVPPGIQADDDPAPPSAPSSDEYERWQP